MNFHVENITPILNVADMSRSLDFYCSLLGFKKADWGTEFFTSVGIGNGSLYLCKGGQGHPGTWVWIGFDGDIMALHEKLKSTGANIKMPPTNFWWAYEMHVVDPDGHILRLGTEPDPNKPYEQGF